MLSDKDLVVVAQVRELAQRFLGSEPKARGETLLVFEGSWLPSYSRYFEEMAASKANDLDIGRLRLGLAMVAVAAYGLNPFDPSPQEPLDALMRNAGRIPRREVASCSDFVAKLLEEATEKNDKRARYVADIIRIYPSNFYRSRGGIS